MTDLIISQFLTPIEYFYAIREARRKRKIEMAMSERVLKEDREYKRKFGSLSKMKDKDLFAFMKL